MVFRLITASVSGITSTTKYPPRWNTPYDERGMNDCQILEIVSLGVKYPRVEVTSAGKRGGHGNRGTHIEYSEVIGFGPVGAGSVSSLHSVEPTTGAARKTVVPDCSSLTREGRTSQYEKLTGSHDILSRPKQKKTVSVLSDITMETTIAGYSPSHVREL